MLGNREEHAKHLKLMEKLKEEAYKKHKGWKKQEGESNSDRLIRFGKELLETLTSDSVIVYKH